MTFAEILAKRKAKVSQTVAVANPGTKMHPTVETQTEFDYEFYNSNYKTMDYLDHLIEDMKGGNLMKGAQEQDVNHLLNCATLCGTWHHNPDHTLRRSKAMFVGEAATMLGVSMSREAKMFDGFRTIREKKHEKRERVGERSLVPDMWGNKKEEEKW